MNTKECKELIVQKFLKEKETILPDDQMDDPDIPKFSDVKYWVRESKTKDKYNQEIVRAFRNTASDCLSAIVGTDYDGNLKYIDIEMD